MKKNDIILIVLILIIAAGGFLFMNVTKKSGDIAVVTVDGKVIKKLPLNKDTAFKIQGVGGSNLLVIENGSAYMKEASCPDKICVHHKKIQNTGETIVCLPNKVVVEILGQGENNLDAVAN